MMKMAVGPMKPFRRQALAFLIACFPVALVLPVAVCGPAPASAPGQPTLPKGAGEPTSVSALSAVSLEPVVSATVHPPMLRAALEGSYATVARHTSTARVAYQPRKIIALTFDDGPGAYTPTILTILKAKGVKATFFVIGRQVPRYPSSIRALASAGMSVQSHTWNHPNLARARNSIIRSEISRTDNVIKAVTGVRPKCVRPPGGAYDSAVISVAAWGQHRVVNWSNDPGDWRRPGVASIRSSVLRHAANNGIVLLHDGGGNRLQTVRALPGIIDGLRARGFSFVTLCQR
jgi:peptidoglycan/xylan/chitin deacetylase (PgdA/CDA1 family)